MEALIQAFLVRCSYAGPLLLFYTLEHCNNWLCTSLDVEAGSCIRYLKKFIVADDKGQERVGWMERSRGRFWVRGA